MTPDELLKASGEGLRAPLDRSHRGHVINRMARDYQTSMLGMLSHESLSKVQLSLAFVLGDDAFDPLMQFLRKGTQAGQTKARGKIVALGRMLCGELKQGRLLVVEGADGVYQPDVDLLSSRDAVTTYQLQATDVQAFAQELLTIAREALPTHPGLGSVLALAAAGLRGLVDALTTLHAQYLDRLPKGLGVSASSATLLDAMPNLHYLMNAHILLHAHREFQLKLRKAETEEVDDRIKSSLPSMAARDRAAVAVAAKHLFPRHQAKEALGTVPEHFGAKSQAEARYRKLRNSLERKLREELKRCGVLPQRRFAKEWKPGKQFPLPIPSRKISTAFVTLDAPTLQVRACTRCVETGRGTHAEVPRAPTRGARRIPPGASPAQGMAKRAGQDDKFEREVLEELEKKLGRAEELGPGGDGDEDDDFEDFEDNEEEDDEEDEDEDDEDARAMANIAAGGVDARRDPDAAVRKLVALAK